MYRFFAAVYVFKSDGGKMMRKIKHIICYALIFVMLFSLCSPAFADSERTYKRYNSYCCIGDSIAAGCGLLRSGEENTFDVDTDYVTETYNNDLIYLGFDFDSAPHAYHTLVADALGAKLCQCARSGIRTVELRYLFDGVYNDYEETHMWADQFLGNTYDGSRHDIDLTETLEQMRKDSKIIESVKKSDLITVNIGSNDVFSFTMIYLINQAFDDMPGMEGIKELLAGADDIAEAFTTLVQVCSIAGRLPELVSSMISNFAKTFIQYCENYTAVLDNIYKLNPDATVISVGMNNPINNVHIDDGSDLNPAFIIQPLIDQMNIFLKGLGSRYDNYYYVDIMGVPSYRINATDANVVDLYILKVHPNIAGHRFIAEKILSILPESGVAAPVIAAAPTETADSVKISWQKASGAKKYKVWRSTSKNGTYKLLTTTTKLSFTDKSAEANTRYYYKVNAINGSAEGCFSNVVTCALGCYAPDVKISNNAKTGKIVLNWAAVPGAAKYEVWRATSKNGTYKKLCTTKNLTVTNNKATTGKTYYYKVRAIGDDGTPGAFSTIVYRTCDCARTVVKALNNLSSGKIVLKWDAVQGASKYQVWRSSSRDGGYKKLCTTKNLKYVDNSVKVGDSYYYKIKAVSADKSSANSAFSTPAKAMRNCARPTVKASLSLLGNPVLTWQSVSSAYKYVVYRSDSANGSYTKVGTVLTPIFTDILAPGHTTCYYKVIAVTRSDSDASSAYSLPVSVRSK